MQVNDRKEEMADPSLIKSEYEAAQRLFPLCRECGMPPGQCYFLCSHSPDYYSPEREREDSLWEDSLSQSEWMSLAVLQYELVHGEPYCS